MKAYTFDDPQLGTISYVDHKRYLWLLSVLFPLVPLVGVGLVLWTGREWMLWLPLAFVYGVIPLLDFLFPNDRSNPPEQLVPQLEADNYYRVLSGIGINTGHELGHKKERLDRLAARLVLAVPAYGHFTMEHNVGHHAEVATPGDSASARFGESIYRFALREIPGGVRRGWRLESERLRRRGYRTWGWRNEILQSYAVSLLLYGGLVLAFGFGVLPFLLIQAAWAWWQLTSANYIEHYGLLRERDASGRYERCQPHHSWNANHLASNLLLFHLERHSDHHAWPARHYQSLRHFEHVPQLPSGYFGMFLLSYVPPLWRRVMDPRVLGWVDGDLNRVNVDPRISARMG
jgi:alkane 1-monooxygenase